MEQSNATTKFLGDDWSNLRIELHDVQALWGGRRIFVAGSGHVTMERIQHGGAVSQQEYELGADEVKRLVNVLMETDFLTIKPAERPGIPDEVRQRIMLVNSAGETWSVEKWAGVKDERFERIFAAISRLDHR